MADKVNDEIDKLICFDHDNILNCPHSSILQYSISISYMFTNQSEHVHHLLFSCIVSHRVK